MTSGSRDSEPVGLAAAYGPEDAEDHVCPCGHPWDDHDLYGPLAGCQALMCRCSPPEPEEEE